MKRTKQREQAFFLIFEEMFSGAEPTEAMALYSENVEELGNYAKMLYTGVSEKKEEIDALISSYLTKWKLSRIAKVNLAILRLAVYEICYVDDVPDSVAINEAVELTKTYLSKEDSAFVNGILGSVVRGKE